MLPYLKMGGYVGAASLVLVSERSHQCRLLGIPTHHRSSAERLAPLPADGGAARRERRLVQEDRYECSARAHVTKIVVAQ